MIPTSTAEALILVVLVLPGVVYSSVRTAVGGYGPHDRQVSTRVLRAILASVAFAATYLLVGGEWLVNSFTVDAVREQPRIAGMLAVGLVFAVPALVAYVLHGKPEWIRDAVRRRPKWRLLSWMARARLRLRVTTGYESNPTAWDWAAPNLGERFVRIRLAEGKWVGGYFGANSFVSTYPESRDIYIERQHEVSRDGEIGAPVEGSAGVWLAVNDDFLVEWVESLRAQEERE